MQVNTEKMEEIFASLKEGKITVPGDKEVDVDSKTIKTVSPFIEYVESSIKDYMSLISDSFIQMSFQDLTG